MGFERAVQLIQHDARLNHRAAVFHVDFKDAVKVACVINDQPRVDRLPALGCPAPASCHGHTSRARGIQGSLNVFARARRNHPSGHHLVDRCIGRIPPPREPIKEDIPLKILTQRLL